MPHKRSAHGQARQLARRDVHADKVLGALAAASAYPIATMRWGIDAAGRTNATTDRSNALPAGAFGTPTLPDSRGEWRTEHPLTEWLAAEQRWRAREHARGERTAQRAARRPVTRKACDGTESCICAGCISDRRAARLYVEQQRARNVAYATGRTWT